MSIERLIQCDCGHTVDEHEAGGCRHRTRTETTIADCACRLSRTNAIDRIVESERTAIHDRWRAFDARRSA